MWFNSFSTAVAPPELVLKEDDRVVDKGMGYVFNDDLVAAVDIAIGLRRPLLVSGEPGCGKTELGYAIARRLGIETVYFYSTKSTSEARDLFYTYDAIGRFRDAQLARTQEVAPPDIGDYVEFQALGRAILDAHPLDDIKALLRGRNGYVHPPSPKRSVVIIDEIDKAPRDFPNDLLREIEDLSFRIPEFGKPALSHADATPDAPEASEAPAANEAPKRPETPSGADIPLAARPIIVITSNEERQLPDAFLRRCIFHEIAFPDDDRGDDQLAKIVISGLAKRLPPGGDPKDPDRFVLPPEEVRQLVKLIKDFRKLPLDKKPGISELIDAATLMAYPSRTLAPPLEPRRAATTAAVAKLKGDRALFVDLLLRSARPT